MDKTMLQFVNRKPKHGRRDKFILIGAALPRTGTVSLKHALQIILPGSTSHMVDIFHFHREWETIYSGNASDEDFKNFFLDNGFVAGVDAPFCYHYKQAMRAFPEAKVLLTQRDPEKWITSVANTIVKSSKTYAAFSNPVFRFILNIIGPSIKIMPYFLEENTGTRLMCKSVEEGKGAEYYRNYQKEVEEFVPSDKLLRFSVKDGWEPLCKFLDVEVPDVPFPHLNDRESFGKMRAAQIIILMIFSFFVIMFPIFIGLFCYRFFA